MVSDLMSKEKIIEKPKNFKKIFLLNFTKELILHSASGELLQLKNILTKENEEKKQEIKREKKRIKEIIKKKESKISPLLEKKEFIQNTPKKLPQKIIKKPRVLRIPETKLPPHLTYLRPTPTSNVEMDLEKLNPLIKDPAVRNIEVNPDEKVFVSGAMGRKPTNIILNKEETNKIIKKFSETAKIPIQEGVFKVVVGRLILSAIVSDVVGSKFIIKKMLYPTNQTNTPKYLPIPEPINKKTIMPRAPKIPAPKSYSIPKI